MEFLGFFLGLVILVYLTAALGFAGMYGGEEFSSLIKFKTIWWYAPLCLILVWFWWLLFTYSPFSITINT
jgi:hypothetical protein